MLMRRNRLDADPFIPILAVVLVLAVVITFFAMKEVIRKQKEGIDSITQTEERNISLYLTDKQKITGQEAINVIGLFKDEKVRFKVVTGAGSTAVYNYDGTGKVPSYEGQHYSTGDDNYINPSGVFIVSISDNEVTLTQSK